MATRTPVISKSSSARPGHEGLVGWLTSTDHKRIAINTGAAALFFFLLGGLMALTIRAQISQPNNHIVSDHVYTELFTMHGSTMIYLFVTPMALALCMYLVPLQIGAASLAGARVALMGFWIYLIGGLTMESGWLTVGGAGRSGWFSYVPLSETPWTQGQGMNLWVIGVIMAVTGVILMSWCVVVTIARRRAPGMALLRMPPFTWTALVSVLMVLAAFPVLVAAMVMLFLDRTTSSHIYSGFNGIIDYQNFFWFYGHPVVYVMFFPYLGCAVEAIATNARKRWFGYTAFVASMMAFSVLSTSVWGHHMFITGGSYNEFFSFTSTLLIVPAGIEYFDMAGTLIGGSLVMRTSMLFALTFFLQFLIGGVTGIYVASPVLDYGANDTYFVVGHFHYTLFAGSIFGFFAGVYHWFPKVTGALLREKLGKLQLVVMIIGTNMTFGPMFVLGTEGMPRRISRYPQHPGWGTLNLIESIGAGIIAIGIAIFLYNIYVSMRHKEPAGADPWGGQSLEWWTTSPPPRLNFETPLPPIRSYAPLLDLREEAEDRERERAEKESEREETTA